MKAAENAHLNAVKVLVSNGANLNIQNDVHDIIYTNKFPELLILLFLFNSLSLLH